MQNSAFCPKLPSCKSPLHLVDSPVPSSYMSTFWGPKRLRYGGGLGHETLIFISLIIWHSGSQVEPSERVDYQPPRPKSPSWLISVLLSALDMHLIIDWQFTLHTLGHKMAPISQWIYPKGTVVQYRARNKGLYVVARDFFLLLLTCSACTCLAVA